MKAYLTLIFAAVIGLATCSQEAAKLVEAPAASAAFETAPARTTAPADIVPASEATSTDAAAAPVTSNCATTVETNDAMQFSAKEVQISKACREFTITSEHTGIQPKESMDHNIAIGKAEDMDGTLKDGVDVAATDYVKPDDVRVVAYTKLASDGEEVSLTPDPTKLASGEYKSAYTFPDHGALVNGKVTLVD